MVMKTPTTGQDTCGVTDEAYLGSEATEEGADAVGD